ncbi:MAG: hypothetical protein ACWGON_07620 [Gemmatimonadota bacterium]
MRTTLIRDMAVFLLATVGPILIPGTVRAQEGHEEHAEAAEHQETGDHAEHGTHEKNEIAVFFGGTRRLKLEDDETGATFGVEYARALTDRATAALVVEWASGDIERDWVAILGVGVRPFYGWIDPLTVSVGAGIEVASLDERLLDLDSYGDTGGEGGEETGHAAALQEEHDDGERETEVDALIRIGIGWPIHVGSFSIIPTVNGDIVGEDWAIVGGVTIGYRF